MDKIFVGIGGAVLIGVLLLFAAISSALFGAMGGWAVGWIFDETTAKVLPFVGLQAFEMWEIGATLGFFGSFFKSSCSNSSN